MVSDLHLPERAIERRLMVRAPDVSQEFLDKQVHAEDPETRQPHDAIDLVLAESYPVLLEGMNRLFRAEPRFRVLACCSTGEEAIAAVRRHQPSVLVLDSRIAGRNAFDVLRQVATEPSPPRVILYAESLREDEMLEATRHGARGLILKSMTGQLLVQCVRKVHRGGTWIEKVSMGRIVDRLIRANAGDAEMAERLTMRELQVLRMVARGHSNKEIAEKLHVCEGTIKSHLHHVYEKLGVKGRLELALYARDRGMLSVLVR
jgi:DNA-binding NarL/FixJ family response regulator